MPSRRTAFTAALLLLLSCSKGEMLRPPEATVISASPGAAPSVASEAGPLGKLAYVQGGDIWVKALPNGEPIRLTHDGDNGTPRWSPSGEWLAFQRTITRNAAQQPLERELWLVAADGSRARRVQEPDRVSAFAWSPTGKQLAYVVTRPLGVEPPRILTIVDADGESRVQIPDVLHFAWSPDGQWLAYDRLERRDDPGAYGLPWRSASIWRIRFDGSEANELVNAGSPSSHDFVVQAWSSDGSYVLYRTDPMFSASFLADGVAPLFAIPADGGTPMPLAERALLHADFISPDPVHPDRLALVVGGYRATWTRKGLHLFSLSTGEDLALTSADTAASSPSWSSDGERLAYVAMIDNGDLVGGDTARLGMLDRRIYVIEADSSGQYQLTDDPAYRDEHPLWSADGSVILFARFDSANVASLWHVLSQGGRPERVVDELTPAPPWFGYYGHITWDAYYNWWRPSLP